MKRPLACAVIAVAALGAGISMALAQEGQIFGHNGRHGHGGSMMHRMDLNDDGAISPVEASAVRTVHFLRLDTDGDGIITEAEMLERMQKRIAEHVAKRFAMMDRNGDGRVERTEFEETGTARFVRMDTDGDGRVSSEEFRAQPHGWERSRHDDQLPPK